MALCVEDVDKLIRYVELKLLNIKDDIDEYNEDEEDKDVLVEELPYYKSFLIGHLIEFIFLKNDSKGLGSYLKLHGSPITKNIPLN